MDKDVVGVENFSVLGEAPRGAADNTQTVLTGRTTMTIYVVDGTDLAHVNFLANKPRQKRDRTSFRHNGTGSAASHRLQPLLLPLR